MARLFRSVATEDRRNPGFASVPSTHRPSTGVRVTRLPSLLTSPWLYSPADIDSVFSTRTLQMRHRTRSTNESATPRSPNPPTTPSPGNSEWADSHGRTSYRVLRRARLALPLVDANVRDAIRECATRGFIRDFFAGSASEKCRTEWRIG